MWSLIIFIILVIIFHDEFWFFVCGGILGFVIAWLFGLHGETTAWIFAFLALIGSKFAYR